MGWKVYGRYLAHVAPDLAERFGRDYIGDSIGEQFDRDSRRELCFSYIGECLKCIVHTKVSLPELLEQYGKEIPRDTRTTKQVTADIIAGLSDILEKRR